MINFIQFTVTRALLACLTLFLVSLIVFSLMEFVPSNCAERYLAFKNTQGSNITIEDIEAEEKKLGLDRPFAVRFTSWISNIVLKGEFGQSCILRMDINELLSGRFMLSLLICIICYLLMTGSHTPGGAWAKVIQVIRSPITT